MPKDSTSPFTPGIPVPVEFFVGRRPQIELLRNKVRNSVSGRVEVGFVVGERGIGKSSLASFIRALAEKDFGVLGVHTFLGGITKLEDMVEKILDSLVKESMEAPWYGKIAELFQTYIRQVGLFGVSVAFEAPQKEMTQLTRGFIPALRTITEKIKDDRRGLLLILDDINGLADSVKFANWVKSLVDEIATSGKPLPLCLLLVGIDERRNTLIQHQPSLDRILDVVEIKAWSEDETREFYSRNFDKAGIEVQQGVVDLLAEYCGGLPVIAHEIGDAAFNADTDNVIDKQDAWLAITNAAEIVGRKHLKPKVLDAIRSDRYKSILRKLVERGKLDFRFTRKGAIEKLSGEERRVFDNFIRKMRELGAIIQDPEGPPGSYVFANQLHHFYFWMQTRAHDKANRR